MLHTPDYSAFATAGWECRGTMILWEYCRRYIEEVHISGAYRRGICRRESPGCNYQEHFFAWFNWEVNRLEESINILYEDGSLPDRYISILAEVVSIEWVYMMRNTRYPISMPRTWTPERDSSTGQLLSLIWFPVWRGVPSVILLRLFRKSKEDARVQR